MKATIGLAIAAVVLAACSGEVRTIDETPVVNVSLTEFGISYMSEPFEVGDTVTFNVTNNGLITHEFEVTGNAAISEHLEGGHDGHMEEKAATTLTLEPGETKTVTWYITHATDIAVCLLPGHYEAGMWINLTR